MSHTRSLGFISWFRLSRRWDPELGMNSPKALTSAARRWRLLQRTLRVAAVALLVTLMLFTFSFDHKFIVRDNRAFIASLRRSTSTSRNNLHLHTQPRGGMGENGGDTTAHGSSIISPIYGEDVPPTGRKAAWDLSRR